MLNLPDYWLTRPGPEPDEATQRAFDTLLDEAVARGAGAPVAYTLAAPKWQFLCHAAERRGLALHGSGNPAIAEFEPRQSNDLNEFGNQRAVYAAADGIWAMFFAIVDRDGFQMAITNACVRLEDAGGRVSEPLYVFAVSQTALPHRPWRSGTVYLLPRATFTQQAPFPFGESRVHVAQLASTAPVVPLARLTVAPEDFPFLSQIRGQDDTRLEVYQQALMTGSPWPE